MNEHVCISLWHMAYKELFKHIDASVSMCCFIIWIRKEANCKCVFALHSTHVILFFAPWTGAIVFVGRGYRFWPVRTHKNFLLIVRVGNTRQIQPPR